MIKVVTNTQTVYKLVPTAFGVAPARRTGRGPMKPASPGSGYSHPAAAQNIPLATATEVTIQQYINMLRDPAQKQRAINELNGDKKMRELVEARIREIKEKRGRKPQ